MAEQRRNEARSEDRNLEAVRARELANSPGREMPGRVGAAQDRVLVQVCLECGKEYMFEADPPPERLTCEKCGSVVFRSFYSSATSDDVAEDYRELTERDLATDDAKTDDTRMDVRDLKKL